MESSRDFLISLVYLIISSERFLILKIASSIFLILSLVLVIGNFLADIALALLDPRIRDMSGGDA